MKRKLCKVHVGMGLAMLLILFSCKSPPPATEPVVEEPPAPVVVEPVVTEPVADVKPVDDALIALREKAAALEATGKKYGIDKWKASEWKEAADVHAVALGAYGKDYDLSKTSFEDAIDRYEALIDSSFKEISVQLEEEIIRARAEVVAAGGDAYFPAEFALADDAVDKTLDAKSKDDRETAYNLAQVALMRFKTLSLGMKAVSLNQKIIDNSFIESAPQEYALAGVKYEEAAAAYGTADAASFEAATECVALLEKVNNAGFKVWSLDEAEKSEEIRLLCNSIMAEKAMAKEYDAADTLHRDAQLLGSDDQWEEAYYKFEASTAAFAKVYQETSLKRNAADLAIANAKNKQTKSTELAIKADTIAPLPEGAEGFDASEITIEELEAVEGETK